MPKQHTSMQYENKTSNTNSGDLLPVPGGKNDKYRGNNEKRFGKTDCS